jgi:hypothetical protein
MIDFIQQLSISGALLVLAFIMLLTSAFHWTIRDESVATDESMVNYAQMITIFYGLLMGLVAVNLWQRMDDAEKNTVTEANQVRIVSDLGRSVTGDKTTLVDALADYVQSVVKKEWPMMLDGQQREMFVASPELDSVRVAIMELDPGSTSEQAAVQEMLNHYEQLLAARQRRLLDSEFSMPAVLRITLIVGAVFISNWIGNSGFENEPTGQGFDWRIQPSPGVTTVPARGRKDWLTSLRIQSLP